MLRTWFERVKTFGPAERRQSVQGALVIFGLGAAAFFMWQNAEIPLGSTRGNAVILEEEVISSSPSDDQNVPPRSRRLAASGIPQSTLDQLIIHVDKHGNIDVAGELINADNFRNLLQSVKRESTGDVAVLIHANEKCAVSTLQEVVDVCEESLTQYRLRIEDARPKSKAAEADPTRA